MFNVCLRGFEPRRHGREWIKKNHRRAERASNVECNKCLNQYLTIKLMKLYNISRYVCIHKLYLMYAKTDIVRTMHVSSYRAIKKNQIWMRARGKRECWASSKKNLYLFVTVNDHFHPKHIIIYFHVCNLLSGRQRQRVHVTLRLYDLPCVYFWTISKLFLWSNIFTFLLQLLFIYVK